MSTFPRAIRGVPTFAFIATLTGCIGNDPRDQYAAAVDRYLPTPFADAHASFLDPVRALGPPDGRTVALGVGAYLTVRFFRQIPDGPGPDLRVYKIGPDAARARVAVSRDGVSFHELPEIASGLTTEYDLAAAGETFALFVRIRGLDDVGNEPGYNLDAVESLH